MNGRLATGLLVRPLWLAEAGFEAAVRLDGLAADDRRRGLHGHSYRVRLHGPATDGSQPDPCALAARLAAAVAPFDYSLLNDHLANPADADLLAAIVARFGRSDVVGASLRAQPDGGIEITDEGRPLVWQRFSFEAAHRLPHVPAGHPCGRMHGHGFEVVLYARHTADGCTLQQAWSTVADQLDHACLNDIAGLHNPTSEHLAAWLWQQLTPLLPALVTVVVYETHSAGCCYDGQSYSIWKEQRFEAALCLPSAPEGDRRRRLHGHSYRVRLYLTAPLDAVMGWTVDYGDIKALFTPLYQQLDHHRLDGIDGLAAADGVHLAAWMHERMVPLLPSLNRIDLLDTPASGVTLLWGNGSLVGTPLR